MSHPHNGRINLSKTANLKMSEVNAPISWQKGHGTTGAIICLDMRQCMELARIGAAIGRTDMPTELERALIPFLAPFEEKFDRRDTGIWETFMTAEDMKAHHDQNSMEANMGLEQS